MYNVQLNIGSLSSPATGGGWVDVNPILTGVSIEKKMESGHIFARKSLGGTLTFLDEYSTLLLLRESASKCDIRVQVDGDTMFEGELSLYGKWFDDTGRCDLKVMESDEYDDILNGEKDKFNLINCVPKIPVEVQDAYDELTFTDEYEADKAWELWSGGYPSGYFGKDIYARQEAIYPDSLADEFIGSDGWIEVADYADGTKMIARTHSDGGFPAITGGDLIALYGTTAGTLTINDQVRINERQATYLYATNEVLGSGTATVYVDNVNYYDYGSMLYTRFRRLDKLLQQMVGELDDSVEFTNASFSYLYENDDLADLMVASMKDVIPDGSVEPVSANDKEDVKFRDLMEGLEAMNIYWRLNEGLFELKHISELNYTAGTLDLTDYRGADWTPDEYEYLEEDKYQKIVRQNTADNFDFRGVNLEVPKLANIDKILEIGEWIFFTDIQGIVSQGTEIFPNKGLCLLTTNLDATDFSPVNGRAAGGLEFDTYSATGNDVTIAHSGDAAQVHHDTQITCAINEGVFVHLTADITGDLLCGLTDSAGSGVKSDLWTIYDGNNRIALTPNEDGDFYLSFFFLGVGSVSAELTDIQYGEKYICRQAVGKLTGQVYPNAELSQANLDEGHGGWQMPETPMTVNLSSREWASERLKKDKQIKMNAPVYTDVPVDELITTGKGEVEFKSMKNELNTGKAEITGVYR